MKHILFLLYHGNQTCWIDLITMQFQFHKNDFHKSAKKIKVK